MFPLDVDKTVMGSVMPKSFKAQLVDLQKTVFEYKAELEVLRKKARESDHVLWEARDRLREMNKLCDTQRGAIMIMKATIALLRLSAKGRKLAMDHAEGKGAAWLQRSEGNGMDAAVQARDEHIDEHEDEHAA